MTDMSPLIPSECDLIVVKERFRNTSEFTGTEYKFIFKKRVSILGVKFSRTIKSDVVRSELFLRPKDIELSGKPSLNEFKEFVKGWKVESKGPNWSVLDHIYTKEIEAA